MRTAGRVRAAREPGGRAVDQPGGRAVDRERGSGTVLVLGLVAVTLLLVVGVGALGAAQNARGAAQSAADLAAIAGATALRDGFDPCGTARATVSRNGAEVAACEVLGGGVVRVAAARPVGGPARALVPGRAHASARAGPRADRPQRTGPTATEATATEATTKRR